MKVALIVLPFLLMACVANAMPVEPDTISTVDEVHANSPYEATIEETREESSEESDSLVRQRRSPFQPRGGNGGGFGQPRPQESRGSVSGSVHRERGVGTIVNAQGQGNVWTSKDGNSRIDANGRWSKVVSGPARGKPSYNVGATFEHRFPG